MTREERLQWCKDAAMHYLNTGDLPSAVASMGNDMVEYELRSKEQMQSLLILGISLIQFGPEEVRKWINGFK